MQNGRVDRLVARCCLREAPAEHLTDMDILILIGAQGLGKDAPTNVQVFHADSRPTALDILVNIAKAADKRAATSSPIRLAAPPAKVVKVDRNNRVGLNSLWAAQIAYVWREVTRKRSDPAPEFQSPRRLTRDEMPTGRMTPTQRKFYVILKDLFTK